MWLFVSALAVYKAIQVIDLFLPKEPMPWVKALAGVLLGYASAFIINAPFLPFAGLAIATLAGGTHSVLRLLTLAGDLAHRRSLR
jgi:hypothetical protein